MTESQKLEVRVVLNGEVAQRFLEIKRRKGIGNNADVVRFVVSEYYEQMKKGEEAVSG